VVSGLRHRVFSSLPYPLTNQPLEIALTLRELERLQIQRGVYAPTWTRIWEGLTDDYTGNLYLEGLWTGPASQQTAATRMIDAYWFTEFLEQEFGRPALVKLLQNMSVTSPYEAFPAITSVPFDEVQQRWAAWLKSRTH
jgi:hypothetical protein